MEWRKHLNEYLKEHSDLLWMVPMMMAVLNGYKAIDKSIQKKCGLVNLGLAVTSLIATARGLSQQKQINENNIMLAKLNDKNDALYLKVMAAVEKYNLHNNL